MIDQDIDYCDQQIEAQAEKIDAINAAENRVRKEICDIEAQIENMKKERGRLYYISNQLAHKRKVEVQRQRDMIEHRDNLKDLKAMMKVQNRMIEKSKKGNNDD